MKIASNITNFIVRWVANLIDQDDHIWKENMVREDFYHRHHVEEILKIKLANCEDNDFIARTLERNDASLVRSA
jgi:hypothetical protein